MKVNNHNQNGHNILTATLQHIRPFVISVFNNVCIQVYIWHHFYIYITVWKTKNTFSNKVIWWNLHKISHMQYAWSHTFELIMKKIIFHISLQYSLSVDILHSIIYTYTGNILSRAAIIFMSPYFVSYYIHYWNILL